MLAMALLAEVVAEKSPAWVAHVAALPKNGWIQVASLVVALAPWPPTLELVPSPQLAVRRWRVYVSLGIVGLTFEARNCSEAPVMVAPAGTVARSKARTARRRRSPPLPPSTPAYREPMPLLCSAPIDSKSELSLNGVIVTVAARAELTAAQEANDANNTIAQVLG